MLRIITMNYTIIQLNNCTTFIDSHYFDISPSCLNLFSPRIRSNHDVILRRVAGRAINPTEIHAQRPAHPGGVHEVIHGGYDLVELVIVCGKTPS